jgi:hypothetical protein
MHLHMYLVVYVLYIKLPQELCVYICFNCMHFKKYLCGITQLDVGYVTICFVERMVKFLWRSVAHHGWSRMLHGLTTLSTRLNKDVTILTALSARLTDEGTRLISLALFIGGVQFTDDVTRETTLSLFEAGVGLTDDKTRLTTSTLFR